SEHNGASRTAGLNTSIHDAGGRHVLALLADTPAGAVSARGSGQPRVYRAGVFGAGGFGRWHTHTEEAFRAHAGLSALRTHAGPRRHRGQNHARVWTPPAASRGGACGDEPSPRWALAHAECQ